MASEIDAGATPITRQLCVGQDFQDGIMGWLMHKRPEWFGIKVDDKTVTAEAAE